MEEKRKAKKNINKQQRAELKTLERRGLLRPEDVVEFASDPDTALHSRFQWDDEKAGHAYRLWQARQLIKVVVEVVAKDTEPINAYVSLQSDRQTGGYRTLVSVLSDDEKREELLLQAWRELEFWERKYRQLEELAPIFEAASKAKKQKRKRKAVPA